MKNSFSAELCDCNAPTCRECYPEWADKFVDAEECETDQGYWDLSCDLLDALQDEKDKAEQAIQTLTASRSPGYCVWRCETQDRKTSGTAVTDCGKHLIYSHIANLHADRPCWCNRNVTISEVKVND